MVRNTGAQLLVINFHFMDLQWPFIIGIELGNSQHLRTTVYGSVFLPIASFHDLQERTPLSFFKISKRLCNGVFRTIWKVIRHERKLRAKKNYWDLLVQLSDATFDE